MKTQNVANSPDRADLATLPIGDLERRLTTAGAGLTGSEVAQRLVKYGYNELTERHENAYLKFLRYFWGPIPWMIEIAAGLSIAVRRWPDFAIITTLLFVNAVVGFWEEFQAGNAIAALKQQLALRARVKRDGLWQSIAARELVPGDLIHVRLGDIVPADARLLDGSPIEVDQSALTGESLPVEHRPGDGVYSGSIVRRGEIDALVYATGTTTYFGKTAALVEEAKTASHFQRAVLRIGNFLIVVALVLVSVILVVSFLRGSDLIITLQFALILTVAAIPVAMPTVLSITMAVGARLLAREQAIVRRLAAIEELAGVDILCSDKTGTLTQNKLTLGEPTVLEGVDREALVMSAVLSSRAEGDDAIDLAVLRGWPRDEQISAVHVIDFVPFDPVRKRAEATVQAPDGATFKITKGAPQVIAALLAADDPARAEIDAATERFAVRGYRSLAVARAARDDQWRALGVLPLFDPPRDDARAMLAAARDLGVEVKMVTGDQVAIAREIARDLGLGANILDAAQIAGGGQNQDQVAAIAERTDGFAQVFPEHKFHLVEALQHRGHIVGMTGDGVNDAPALRKADAGIAVAGATDAARAAAAIVLVSPGISVIVDAIRESRKIFSRMTNYAIYRIAETIRVLIFLTLSILAFNFYPVTAIMIVLLAILNDGAILSIAYDNTSPSKRPEAWNMRSVLTIAGALGSVGVVESFLLLLLADQVFHLDRALIQSMIYLKLSVAGHLTLFVARTRGPFWSIKPAPILLGAVVLTQLLATCIVASGFLMAPLPLVWVGLVWGYAIIWFLVEDRAKLLAYHLLDRGKEKRRQKAESPARP